MAESSRIMELKQRLAKRIEKLGLENNSEECENNKVLEDVQDENVGETYEDYEDFDESNNYDADEDNLNIIMEEEDEANLKGLEVGDVVRVVYDGGEIFGKLKKLGINFIQVSSENSLWCRIRIQDIKILELVKKVYVNYEIPFGRKFPGTSQVIAVMKDMLEDILRLDYIELSRRIYTNAEVVSYDRFSFKVKDYYTNKLIVCKKNASEAKSRSDFRTEKILGKRVHWCGALEEGTCSNTLFEMTYADLVAQLPRKLVKSSNKSKTLLRSLILYLRDTLATPKAKLELNNFHEMAEFFYGPLGIEEIV